MQVKDLGPRALGPLHSSGSRSPVSHTVISFWVLEREVPVRKQTAFPRSDLHAVITAAAPPAVRYIPWWLFCSCLLEQVSKRDFALPTQEAQSPLSMDSHGFELLPRTHLALKRKCPIWRIISTLLPMHPEQQIINSISQSPGSVRQILDMQLNPPFFNKKKKYVLIL